jgi:ABC-type uncharacterized transport system permease subunit
VIRVVVAILVALGLICGALYLADLSPVQVAQSLYKGAFGSPAAISGTLKETTPLLLAGLAVFVALRAGLFNIGVEGQLLVGALACTYTTFQVPGEAALPAGIAAGVLGGLLWALPAAWIRAYRGGHEVITTIMLNSVAAFLTTALVAGPLKARGQQSPTTAAIYERLMLPMLNVSPVQVNVGLVVGLGLCALVAFWFSRMVAGYELRLAGANPTAAEMAGVSVRSKLMRAMSTSGAIAGLAGAVQVLAFEGRFYEGMSPGYGFDALGVALLAGNSALGVIPSALLFGALAKGATAIQVLGVPKGITTALLGLAILIAAIARARRIKSHE